MLSDLSFVVVYPLRLLLCDVCSVILALCSILLFVMHALWFMLFDLCSLIYALRFLLCDLLYFVIYAVILLSVIHALCLRFLIYALRFLLCDVCPVVSWKLPAIYFFLNIALTINKFFHTRTNMTFFVYSFIVYWLFHFSFYLFEFTFLLITGL